MIWRLPDNSRNSTSQFHQLMFLLTQFKLQRELNQQKSQHQSHKELISRQLQPLSQSKKSQRSHKELISNQLQHLSQLKSQRKSQKSHKECQSPPQKLQSQKSPQHQRSQPRMSPPASPSLLKILLQKKTKHHQLMEDLLIMETLSPLEEDDK